VDIHYERLGNGPPLVLVHGLGGTGFIWRPVLKRLAAEREVIVVDMPGFGRSPVLPPGTAATAANLGAAIRALCDSLGIARPHYAGNSLGAWAALEVAKRGGAASVCAISPAGLWRRALGPRRGGLRRFALHLEHVVPALLTVPRLRGTFLRTTMAHPERLTRTEATQLVSGWIASPGYEAANHEMRSHVFEDPEQVRVPVTIAWGERDRLVGPPRPERRPPGARFLSVPAWGHTPTWDDPDGVAQLILEASGGPAQAAAASSGSSSPGQAPVAR
jgi:pimeloyl-ACP methyl ester carboxylesterase